MSDTKACPACGVPEYITSEHRWLDNGDIVHSRDERRRLVFIESENIDPLLHGIEELIGVSIERIVIASVQENVRAPLALFIPDDVKERVRKGEMDYRPLIDTFATISRNMGRGGLEVIDMRYERGEEDFCTFRMTEPFSIPLNCGARAAGMEALLGYAHSVSYEQISPQVYEITVFPAEHAVELEERLAREEYHHRAGDIALERCSTCGGPLALSVYDWHQERGVIVDRSTGRRMVMTAPYELDPVFQELEAELGDTIPRLVVEAQRRYTHEGFYSLWKILHAGDFREQFAMRGLGNIKEIEVGKEGLRMRLDNAILHLMIVGTIQGAFEAVSGADSRVEWELSPGGNLEIEVTPVSSPVTSS